MSDVSKINLYGTDYTIKDATARTTANTAKTTADNASKSAATANAKAEKNSTNITSLTNESVVISYDSTKETVSVSKGIALGK